MLVQTSSYLCLFLTILSLIWYSCMHSTSKPDDYVSDSDITVYFTMNSPHRHSFTDVILEAATCSLWDYLGRSPAKLKLQRMRKYNQDTTEDIFNPEFQTNQWRRPSFGKFARP